MLAVEVSIQKSSKTGFKSHYANLVCLIPCVTAGGVIQGDIRMNGYPKEQATFARVSGYVEQFDVHSPQTTVREALLFSAQLRTRGETTEVITAFVDEVMDLVELHSLRDGLVSASASCACGQERVISLHALSTCCFCCSAGIPKACLSQGQYPRSVPTVCRIHHTLSMMMMHVNDAADLSHTMQVCLPDIPMCARSVLTDHAHPDTRHLLEHLHASSTSHTWAARYNTWLPITLTPKGVVFSSLLSHITCLTCA